MAITWNRGCGHTYCNVTLDSVILQNYLVVRAVLDGVGDRAGGSADGADVGAQHGTGDEPVVVLERVAEVVHLIFAVVLAEHAEVVRDLGALATRRGHGLERKRYLKLRTLLIFLAPKYEYCQQVSRSAFWFCLELWNFMVLL